MAPITIYGMMASAPCRNLSMVCEVLGLEYEFKVVDLQKGEHKTPEYLKLNPHHNVPTLVDGDFVTNESRPAAAYLVAKHGGEKKAQLYPEDPETRCKIDQRMYFDMGTLYKAFGDCVYPIMMGPASEIAEDKLARLHEVLGWVNDYVKEGGFLVGSTFTLADVILVASYSTIAASEAVDLSQYAELAEWFEKAKALIPNYEKANGEGAAHFGGWYKGVAASKKN